jgi:TIR domain
LPQLSFDRQGLETVRHGGPSNIGFNTISNSNGGIPEPFLRGCGLSDWQIEDTKLYNPNLTNEEINDIQYRIHDLRVSRAFQINPLFISYSHADGTFVNTVEKHLNKQGVRFWRDIHDTVAGRLERQIDQAIHVNDVVLLVLSEHSTKSDWVEHEVRKAREKERQTGKDTLCPVASDDTWKSCRWPARLREQIMEYNILDFSEWQDLARFQRMFSRLLEGLNLFYK